MLTLGLAWSAVIGAEYVGVDSRHRADDHLGRILLGYRPHDADYHPADRLRRRKLSRLPPNCGPRASLDALRSTGGAGGAFSGRDALRGRSTGLGAPVNRLANRKALVIGGATGIGREVCLLFGEEGADVAVADLPAQTGKDGLVTELRGMGHESFALDVDVTDRARSPRRST